MTDKSAPRTCPMCGKRYSEPPALSRRDNQTEICPTCGMAEALAAMTEAKSKAQDNPLPQSPEELLTHICDNICKERIPGRTQDELDAICEKCAVDRLYRDAEARQLRAREEAVQSLNSLIAKIGDPETHPSAIKRLEFGAQQSARLLEMMGVLTQGEVKAVDIRLGIARKQYNTAWAAAHCHRLCRGECCGLSRDRDLENLHRLIREVEHYTDGGAAE